MNSFFTIKNKLLIAITASIIIHCFEYIFHSEIKRSFYDAILFIFYGFGQDHLRLTITLEVANYIFIIFIVVFIAAHKYLIPNLVALTFIGIHLLFFLPWNTIGGLGDNF